MNSLLRNENQGDYQHEVDESRERDEATLRELVPSMYSVAMEYETLLQVIETDLLPHAQSYFRQQAGEGILAFHLSFKMWQYPSLQSWSLPYAVHISAHSAEHISDPLVRIFCYLPKKGDTFYPFYFSSNGIGDVFSRHFIIQYASRLRPVKGEPKQTPRVYKYDCLPDKEWRDMSAEEREAYHRNLEDLDLLMGRLIGHNWVGKDERDVAVLSKIMQQYGGEDMWYSLYVNDGISYNRTLLLEQDGQKLKLHYHKTFVPYDKLKPDQLRALKPHIHALMQEKYQANPELFMQQMAAAREARSRR